MKFRKDFVTNSSSSSYVCEICGRVESGWDLGLSEAGMIECVNGHIFCADDALERPSKKEMIQMILENEWNKDSWDSDIINYRDFTEEELIVMEEEDLWDNFCTESGYYQVPECLCPICQFIEYSANDLSAYLLKEYGVPRDKVLAEVQRLSRRRKKLYEHEYITYVCKEFDLNPVEIVAKWKEQFDTYSSFKKWLRK